MNQQLLMNFAEAIQHKQIVRLTFRTKDNRTLMRRCAPLDLAPSLRANNKHYKFHFWDYDSVPKPHLLSISPEQIIGLEIMQEHFDPKQVVTWNARWTIARDWF
ncbi:hypothetical protein [Cohnella yongneupensis]|uniref:WYL domain-containing protein n=1 Tax=Cohnella yongneupensis TaxID=425006 RepID=A0ABW0QZI2_9BACL